VVRTVDGGASWQNVTPPGGERSAFHDLEASDCDHAVMLAIGSENAGCWAVGKNLTAAKLIT
jgi:hypothetical protein